MQLGKTIQLITKPDGGIIKHLVKLRDSKEYRERTSRCMVQADLRFLKELVYHSAPSETTSTPDALVQHTIPKKIAFYSNGDQDEIQDLVVQLPKTHQFVCFTSETFLKKVTGLQTVNLQNCFVVELAKPPERPILLSNEIQEKLEAGKEEKGEDFRPNFRREAPPSFVVVNRLQEPGNVGNLLRCCVGFGFKHVYFVNGSADVFNEKVIRASRGALLLRDHEKKAVLTYETGSMERMIEISKEYEMPVIVSDTQESTSTRLDSISTGVAKGKKIIVMNNEASGLSENDREVLKAANSQFLHIPMSPSCQSLNVASAAAVFLYSRAQVIFWNCGIVSESLFHSKLPA